MTLHKRYLIDFLCRWNLEKIKNTVGQKMSLGLLVTLHNRFFMDRCAGGILDNTFEVAEDPRPMLRPLETVGRGR